MIPAIGVMVGSYIVARLIGLMLMPDAQYASNVTRVIIIIASLISIAATTVVCAYLVFGGASLPGMP